jgi:transposase
MMTGHRISLTTARINYKTLRKINPEAARLAVIEYLSTNKGNISDAARVFGIQRTVVYDILKKKKEGDLKDRSRTPLHSPDKTPGETEDKVVEAKNQTHLGSKRLSVYLQKYEKIKVPYGTIRHILRRNKSKLTYRFKAYKKAEKREFIDWYSAKPFQVVRSTLSLLETVKP